MKKKYIYIFSSFAIIGVTGIENTCVFAISFIAEIWLPQFVDSSYKLMLSLEI